MTEHTPARLVRIEAEALLALAARLEGAMAADFERAVEMVLGCGEAGGRIVVTGIGKSGIIAQKVAATLNSTGSPAFFLHAAEALHGDLGMLAPGDVVIALSASGETEELLRLLATLRRIGDGLNQNLQGQNQQGQNHRRQYRGSGDHGGDHLIASPLIANQSIANERIANRWISFCCDVHSTLGRASDIALDCSVAEEACGMGLAPTASTTTMLALGDALAIAVSLRKGFRAEDFAELHPGGRLGKRLARVSQLMHAGDAIPRVVRTTPMSEVIYEMSRKGLGMTTVEDGGKLVGIISDGDLRRLLEREGPHALEKSAGDAMQKSPRTISPGEFAASALSTMEACKITSLIVVDDASIVVGVLHLHDLWEIELI